MLPVPAGLRRGERQRKETGESEYKMSSNNEETDNLRKELNVVWPSEN